MPLGQAQRCGCYPARPSLTGLLYASPEQTGRMNWSVDYRTDFYSLDVTLYQLLRGICPFRYDDSLETIHAHIAKLPVVRSEFNGRIPVHSTRS
jgi:serine/threonine protein kinase